VVAFVAHVLLKCQSAIVSTSYVHWEVNVPHPIWQRDHLMAQVSLALTPYIAPSSFWSELVIELAVVALLDEWEDEQEVLCLAMGVEMTSTVLSIAISTTTG
jgi:L-lactate permease